jgi:DNA helicase-2/ATP-dependent DNA helicase PcrA
VDSPTATDDDCVTLSTIHQAKGLEWKIVFIIFLGEGQFPHRRVIESGSTADIEEETRLFYVAVTRAQDQLYLTFPRYNGRSYDAQFCPPSRFLTTIPPELMQLWGAD